MIKILDRLLGSSIKTNGSVGFGVWAPKKKKIEIVITGGKGYDENNNCYPLNNKGGGFFEGEIKEAGEGTLYKIKLDNNSYLIPDPISAFQPEGPHGPSQVVSHDFPWTDQQWRGLNQEGNIIYEMHLGTFTKEGTWTAASKQLEELASIGITVIELMPISEFVGKHGWGYDGVDLFAPYHFYGSPAELKAFINKAHSVGIGVILDVVYNHFGPDGNYLREFSDSYFSKKHKTDWGDAINYDEKDSDLIREIIKGNALYWIQKYHFDGLRLDATQDIFDETEPHIIQELQTFVRENTPGKTLYLVAENEPQHVTLVLPVDNQGCGLNALWNDDFHHTAMVALTGRNEAYYTDYLGTPQEFVSVAKYGFLYQGQWYKWQKKRRGMPAIGVSKSVFVMYIQNHDQIANAGRGLRCHMLAAPGIYKAVTTFMMLCNGTPMLFMGQEFGSSNPFYYFADHKKELNESIKKGRAKFLHQFRSLATIEMQRLLVDPSIDETFLNSKLDFSERKKNKHIYDLHKDLIKIKRYDPVISSYRTDVDGAVLSNNAFVIRYFGEDDRILIVNLGSDLHLDPAPEPLLAPPYKMGWELIFSTEDPKYFGSGTAPLESKNNWVIPGHAAVLLKPFNNPEL